MKHLTWIALIAVAPACLTTRRSEVVEGPTQPQVDPANWFSVDQQEPPLHPRDEGAFDAPEPGFVIENGPFAHDYEEDGSGGRMYLLELYQQALERAESLEREVIGLTTTLDATYNELDASQAEVHRLNGRAEQLAADVEHLRKENLDLGARLATAQIRRLEAEKMLLEAKIEWAEFLRQDELRLTGGLSEQPRQGD